MTLQERLESWGRLYKNDDNSVLQKFWLLGRYHGQQHWSDGSEGGFNYYLAGHRIKLMSGLEYADLSGQNLWTASFGFRMFWGPHSKGPFPMAQTLKAR